MSEKILPSSYLGFRILSSTAITEPFAITLQFLNRTIDLFSLEKKLDTLPSSFSICWSILAFGAFLILFLFLNGGLICRKHTFAKIFSAIPMFLIRIFAQLSRLAWKRYFFQDPSPFDAVSLCLSTIIFITMYCDATNEGQVSGGNSVPRHGHH